MCLEYVAFNSIGEAQVFARPGFPEKCRGKMGGGWFIDVLPKKVSSCVARNGT